MSYILTFGKHKGELISEIPTNYIIWMINNLGSNMQEAIEAAEEELEEREESGELTNPANDREDRR